VVIEQVQVVAAPPPAPAGDPLTSLAHRRSGASRHGPEGWPWLG
jgi:hypothetical protein